LLVLGVFGQVVTWPLGYILMAKGEKGLYAITETVSNVVRLLLSLILLSYMGLKGLAMAMPILYVLVALLMLPVVYKSAGFTWSASTLRMLVWSALLISTAFTFNRALGPTAATICGVALTLVSGLFCVRGLTSRLGGGHKVVKFLLKMPGGRFVCGLRGL
jgi:antigen flippase